MPPPMPVIVARNRKPMMSSSFREADKAPVAAKRAMPRRSRKIALFIMVPLPPAGGLHLT